MYLDIEILQKVATICERRNGKTIELNRVNIRDGGGQQWDLAYYRNSERLGGIFLYDKEFQKLKQVLQDL